ncbi:MAG: Single-stranded DNA-binding protein [Chloroflexi bacterium]|nr:Single-stranded DNA-binding protein [Chloroflexota bacterium]
MSRFNNNYSFYGNAGGDATSSRVGVDKAVSKVRVAVSNGKDREPLWLNVEAWGGQGERLAAIKKGDRLGVSGHLVVEQYTDKEGKERTSVKVVASSIAYLSPKSSGTEELESDESDPY